ncbi:MAG: NAD-dependent DNA ligase LigA [Candidatus Ornithospirochaeta sp.]
MEVKEEMFSLAQKLKIYQDTYYKEGKSLVSDSEYDRLTDRLIALEKEFPEFAAPDSPTKRVGSDLTNDFPEVQHTIPVLSLDKAYSDESVLDFFSRSIEKKGGELSFAAEEKIDGISMVLYYEDGILVRAVTRGNGSVGNDVTPNIVTIPSIPLSLPEPLDIAVRGEVYLPKKEFEKVNATLPEDEKAANPRNLAAGTVRRQKSQEAARIPLDMYCYEGFWGDEEATPKDHLHIMKKLSDLGFRINPDFAFFSRTKEEAEEKLKEAGLEGTGYGFSDIKEYISRMTEKRPGLDHEIDGLVFKINELDVRQEFGYTEHHPRWAIAYKFESPQAETTLLGITVQVGRTGRITPVAEIAPVALGGSTIRRATLHNQEYIDSLELAIGDRVSITKRGDVIPAVEEVVEKNEEGNTTYKIPLTCPCCGSELVHKGVHLFCPNYDCPDQAKGRISFFSSRDQMDIDSMGPKTVELLWNNKLLKRVEDIYTLDYSKALEMKIPGIGEKTVDALKKSVEESKNRPYATVLSSLGIPDCGTKTARLLSEGGFDSLEKLRLAAEKGDTAPFLAIKGMGEETAKTLIEAFRDPNLLSTINALTAIGLHVSEEMDKKEEEDKPQIFTGEVWCVTGSFENFNPRSKALKEIEMRGGRTVSSVTSKTTHLLVGKGGGSKRADAEKLGVKIITEDEFLLLLGVKLGEKQSEGPQDGFLF